LAAYEYRSSSSFDASPAVAWRLAGITVAVRLQLGGDDARDESLGSVVTTRSTDRSLGKGC